MISFSRVVVERYPSCSYFSLFVLRYDNYTCRYCFVRQIVLDKTLRPVSGRHRRVRPGDASQRPRVPRRVFRVLRVRRGAVQGRLLRRAGRRGLLPAGLRAAQAPGHVRAGANVQPAQGRRPPLAVRAQGPAPEEEERAAAFAHDRGRVQRAHRAQRAEDTAVDTGQVYKLFTARVRPVLGDHPRGETDKRLVRNDPARSFSKELFFFFFFFFITPFYASC